MKRSELEKIAKAYIFNVDNDGSVNYYVIADFKDEPAKDADDWFKTSVLDRDCKVFCCWTDAMNEKRHLESEGLIAYIFDADWFEDDGE